MVTLLLIACFLLAGLLGFAFLAFSRLSKEYTGIKQAYLNFITPAGEGKTSPLADTVDLVAQSIAARFGQQLHASINGQASGMARGLKSVEADLVNAQLGMTGNPLAQIAGVLFEKQIRKNPILGMALSQLNFGGGGGNPPAKSNGGKTNQIGIGI